MIASSRSPDNSLRTEENKNTKVVKARLKWFNASKGFGFVVPEEDPVDAFIHITQLQKCGVHCLGEGAEIMCSIDRREKGAVVTDLVEILNIGNIPENKCISQDEKDGFFRTKGIVKLYFPEKSFGFVTPDDGMKDVFVHKSCLSASEIEEIMPGQRVRLKFKLTDKGREAVRIDIEDTP